MAVDMQPNPDSYTINLPVTFDYKGGRGQNKKGNVIITLIILALTGIVVAGICTNDGFILWQKCLYGFVAAYIGLFLLRFLVFKEQHFSDMYETMKATDFIIGTEFIWNIFDIDYEYPYVCYFKNGKKGIFVRMEKATITGKPDTAMYDHYEAIGDAYNKAHSLNMDIVHIDYMDNVGNDSRMQKLYDDLNFVENKDMHEMLIDIYSNLQEEMRGVYASFDIYLYLTRDKNSNFLYNVQSACSAMLGGNFITYRILDMYELSGVCTALFNLHDFSIIDACSSVLDKTMHSGIIPISVTKADGTVKVINKTRQEQKIYNENKQRRVQEQKDEALRKRHEARHNKKNKTNTNTSVNDESIELFDSVASDDKSSKVDLSKDNNDSGDINLF